jgi:hypothetical protein
MKLDLNNPRNVVGIYVAYKNTDGDWIEAADNQGFQERDGSWELWQQFEGRLVRVQRWLKRSVIAVSKAEAPEIVSVEWRG